MSIEWIGNWAVDGEDKLLKLTSGSVMRDSATAAEMEFYGEVVKLRKTHELFRRALGMVADSRDIRIPARMALEEAGKFEERK